MSRGKPNGKYMLNICIKVGQDKVGVLHKKTSFIFRNSCIPDPMSALHGNNFLQIVLIWTRWVLWNIVLWLVVGVYIITQD